MIDNYLRFAGIVATSFLIVSIIVIIYFYVIDPYLCNRRRKKQKSIEPEVSLRDCIEDVRSMFPSQSELTIVDWSNIIGTVMYKCIKNKGR